MLWEPTATTDPSTDVCVMSELMVQTDNIKYL